MPADDYQRGLLSLRPQLFECLDDRRQVFSRVKRSHGEVGIIERIPGEQFAQDRSHATGRAADVEPVAQTKRAAQEGPLPSVAHVFCGQIPLHVFPCGLRVAHDEIGQVEDLFKPLAKHRREPGVVQVPVTQWNEIVDQDAQLGAAPDPAVRPPTPPAYARSYPSRIRHRRRRPRASVAGGVSGPSPVERRANLGSQFAEPVRRPEQAGSNDGLLDDLLYRNSVFGPGRSDPDFRQRRNHPKAASVVHDPMRQNVQLAAGRGRPIDQVAHDALDARATVMAKRGRAVDQNPVGPDCVRPVTIRCDGSAMMGRRLHGAQHGYDFRA